MPGDHDHEGDREIRHGIRVSAGSVDDANSQFFSGFKYAEADRGKVEGTDRAEHS